MIEAYDGEMAAVICQSANGIFEVVGRCEVVVEFAGFAFHRASFFIDLVAELHVLGQIVTQLHVNCEKHERDEGRRQRERLRVGTSPFDPEEIT